MTETAETLMRCFAAVFPDLPADRIETASVDTVEEWDSIAAVTLAAVVEEEFGVTIDDTDLPDLTSFSAIHEHLRRLEV